MTYRKKQQLRKINGISCQEKVAVELEKYFPRPQYTILSHNGYGIGHADIEIINNDTQKSILGEVKSCTEYFFHKYAQIWRRGMFKMCIPQLEVDFFAFTVRFCGDINDGYKENGDSETYFTLAQPVKEYYDKLNITNCKNEFALGIEKLQSDLFATEDLEKFVKKLPKI